MVGSPPTEVERAARAVERHPAMVRAAAEAGVRLLAGTDSGRYRTAPSPARSGGVTPASGRTLAAAAGSWDARLLGFPVIEHGAPADLVTFDADPREDPSVLERPGLIVLAGRVVRDGAHSIEGMTAMSEARRTLLLAWPTTS